PAPRLHRAATDLGGLQASRAHAILLRERHLARDRDDSAPHRSRHRARRGQADTLARLSAAPRGAGADGDPVAGAVRAPLPPRHQQAARHQYRSAGRGRQSASPPECRRTRAMKRLIAFLVFVVIAGVVALLLTTFPANRETIFPGYMEADLVLVGSEQGGRVETLSV